MDRRESQKVSFESLLPLYVTKLIGLPCTSTEFKDVRKAWRKRKKDEARLAAEQAQRTGQMDPATAEALAWEAEGKWLAH
jgi:hypothetical protein